MSIIHDRRKNNAFGVIGRQFTLNFKQMSKFSNMTHIYHLDSDLCSDIS